MKIAVVILNWNGRLLLERFLPKVMEFSENANIYIADNASTDDSMSFVSDNFPTVTIIQNKENEGYAQGYNKALKNLSEDIFVLLNSDVEVSANWLSPVVDKFKQDTSVAAAQPKILDYNNKQYFEYAGAAGGFLDKYGYPYCRGRIFDTLEKDKGQYNDTVQILWASGACLFVRASSFRMVDGFDEDYFAHQEEIDLCWRLRNLEEKILYVGNSKVYHVGGASLATSNPKKTFFNFRNSLLNLLKNVSGSKIYSVIILRMILDGLAAFQFLFQGKPQHFLAVLKAHFSFYGFVPKFLKKRAVLSSNKKYFHVKSIVYQYFISGKRYFREL